MNKILVFRPDRCSGCRCCELACNFKHNGSYGRAGSLIRNVADDKQLINAALFCHHCKKPVCVGACPVNAIFRDEKSGMVKINEANCIGCGVCTSCPLGGIHMNAEAGVAKVCDLCDGNPACVEYCPRKALVFVIPSEARVSNCSIVLDEKE